MRDNSRSNSRMQKSQSSFSSKKTLGQPLDTTNGSVGTQQSKEFSDLKYLQDLRETIQNADAVLHENLDRIEKSYKHQSPSLKKKNDSVDARIKVIDDDGGVYHSPEQTKNYRNVQSKVAQTFNASGGPSRGLKTQEPPTSSVGVIADKTKTQSYVNSLLKNYRSKDAI